MKVNTPDENPAAKAAREAEQARADAAYITNTQGLLDEETRKRTRRLGRRVTMSGAGQTSAASASSSGSNYVPAGGFGGTMAGVAGGGGGGGRGGVGGLSVQN